MSNMQQNFYNNLNIVLTFGDYEINLVHIALLAPRPGWTVSQHNHLGYELHYIPSGKGTVYVGAEGYELKPDTCYLIGPNIDHEQIADTMDPMSEYGLNFEINLKSRYNKSSKGDYPIREKELSLLMDSLVKTPFWLGEEAVFLRPYFESLYYELNNQYIGYYNNVQNLLSCIIIQLVRTCSMQEKADYQIPEKTLDNRRHEMIHNYICDHYMEASREKLAKELCISVRQLSREINLVYKNQTFGKVLTEVRLSHAVELLTTTDKSIEEIALTTGFSCASYFSKVFKKKYHLTPEQYRTSKIGTLLLILCQLVFFTLYTFVDKLYVLRVFHTNSFAGCRKTILARIAVIIMKDPNERGTKGEIIGWNCRKTGKDIMNCGRISYRKHFMFRLERLNWKALQPMTSYHCRRRRIRRQPVELCQCLWVPDGVS